MQSLPLVTLIAAALAIAHPADAQTTPWSWVRQDQVLNPSGLEVSSFAAQFNALDWNGDGLWDFVINDSTTPQLFLGVETATGIRWQRNLTAFPFLFDYRADGALDLVVSEDFWYDYFFKFYHEGRLLSFTAENDVFDLNNSRNDWFKNPYPLRLYNFANRFHINFNDFDRDGDSDYLFSFYKTSPQDTITGSRIIFFRNQGSNNEPDWKPDSSLFAQFDLSTHRFWAPNLIDKKDHFN